MENITNNHLKEVMSEIIEIVENGEEPPFDIFSRFICELKVSNLLLPAVEHGEMFTYETIELEDSEGTYLPLFTDIEEYEKHETDDDFIPMPFEFDDYIEFIEDDDLDGMYINIEGESMPLEKSFLTHLDFEIDTLDESEEPYDAKELKDIYENASNDSLVEFIRSDDKYDIERLYVELSNSTMIHPLICLNSVDDVAEDGIINVDDVDEFSLCAIEDMDGTCLATVFTDRQAMKNMEMIEDMHYYGQITILSALFDYVLRNDMDGVIINQNTDDYVIPREAIITQASGIEIIVENSKFINCLDYAFLL